jgi:Uma2 family endonuclease
VHPGGKDFLMSAHRFTVDEYHRMIQAGTLTEDDRVELLEGWIVSKTSHDPAHAAGIELAAEGIRGKLPPGWRIRVQSAITLADSEPEPDLAVVRGSHRSFLARHPGPADIGLLIEVADTTLGSDREKGRVYARAHIPCYWIVNLRDRQVEVYTDPFGAETAGYRHHQDYDIRASVPLVLDGQEVALIPVAELLP